MFYTYKAIKDGKIIVKKIEADKEEGVVKYLKDNGYFPIEIRQEKKPGNSVFLSFLNKVTFNDVVNLTRQLAIMLNAGLTIVDSFEILEKQIEKESLQKVIADLDKRVKAGTPLSSALSAYPQYFPNLYISLVKSGEASGKLSEILLKLSETLEKQREFKGKLKGALIYPVIVIIAMLSVMFIMITFVVPKLLNLYKDFDIELPITTQILIGLSSFSSQFWPFILLGVAGVVVLVRGYLKTKQGKYAFDSMILRLPVVNGVIKMAALVDSTRILSILVGSGVSILDALKIIIQTTNNSVYQRSFENIYKAIEKGQSLGIALAQERIFPPILVQMAIYLPIKAMALLIVPLILVVLGLGVWFIVISVITPIYNLTSSFK